MRVGVGGGTHVRDASKGDIGQVLCGRRTCQGACVCVCGVPMCRCGVRSAKVQMNSHAL